MAPKYKLIHFNNRGVAEPARLILALKGIEFEDVRVSHDDWPKLRDDESQYPWGSLPVLHEDDRIIAQSNTIARHLARKFHLVGHDEYEATKCEELVDAMTDFRTSVYKALYEKDEASKEEQMKILKMQTFPKYLKKFEAILKENGTGFFVGKKVTHADLNIANFIQIFTQAFPGLLDTYENLQAHQEKIFNLDGIKEWLIKRPKTQY